MILPLRRCILTNSDDRYELGYRKPPKHTQFVKGRSGNPKGRPRGSQNLDTLLAKAARERVKVTVNGVTRQISKLEASLIQLFNKAASGDPRAIREALSWVRLYTESQQEGLPSPVPDEADKAVMESILKRIRQSEIPSSDTDTDSTAANASRREE